MIVLGLTGSIAMGKSVAAELFRRLGVWVWDADAVVHCLLGPGGKAVAPIEAAFPGVVRGGAVARDALGEQVFADNEALLRLEAIVHPLVYADRNRFLARARRARRPLVVLDVPLLFESGGAEVCDAIAVVSAPHFLQRQRLLRRPGMSVERMEAIVSRQMPDSEKRRRADYVIASGLGRAWAMRAIAAIVARARKLTPTGRASCSRSKAREMLLGRKAGHDRARGGARYRNDRNRTAKRPPDRRDRLCRADQSCCERRGLSRLRQPRAADAERGVRCPRPVR